MEADTPFAGSYAAARKVSPLHTQYFLFHFLTFTKSKHCLRWNNRNGGGEYCHYCNCPDPNPDFFTGHDFNFAQAFIIGVKTCLPKAAPIVDSLFERLKAGKIIDTVPPYLQSIFRPSVQPYIKSWMKYIPANEIKKITIPILIVQGGTDLQVDSAEANLLRQANPKAQLIILDSMNHILKNASVYRMQNLATYSNPALPLAPGLIKAIAIFIIQNKNEGFKTAVKRCCN